MMYSSTSFLYSKSRGELPMMTTQMPGPTISLEYCSARTSSSSLSGTMTVKDARRERASLLDGVLVVEQFAHSPRQDVGCEGLGEVVDPLVEPAVMNDGVARVARHVQYR